MQVHALTLRNFRGFEEAKVTFEPSMTVLVGENGAGKTAVLEGLALALRYFIEFVTSKESRWFNDNDVRVKVFEHEGILDRQRQWPVVVSAAGTLEGHDIDWLLERSSFEGSKINSNTMFRRAQDLRIAVASGEARALPVIAYYSTQRLWPTDPITEVKRGVGSRFDGHEGALDAAASPRHLAAWMFQQTLVELQHRKEVPQLRAIEQAVCQCIEGATRFYFDVKEQDLVFEREGSGALPFATLSDGYRNMVALVADVAWRASVLNPHYGANAAAQSEGVVLIDEVDLHLHPRWQRKVLGDLRRTFPRLQFIVTTHSPQAIASARRDELRVLSNNAVIDARPFVEGRDSNSLLEDVFGVPERPNDVRAKIDELFRLLDEEKIEPAKTLFEALAAHLGPDDPAILRAQWILDHEGAPHVEG